MRLVLLWGHARLDNDVPSAAEITAERAQQPPAYLEANLKLV